MFLNVNKIFLDIVYNKNAVMLYSKRRKNLGGWRKNRSNRKSFMSGGSGGPYNYKPGFSTPQTTLPLDVDVLCDLIYRNTPIYSKQFKPFFNYTPPDQPHIGGFGPLNPSQQACINSTSTRGLSPLYTACRNHSDIILIKFLIEHTIDLYKLNGLLSQDQNTAAHAVAYSYCINNCDVIFGVNNVPTNVQQLHDDAEHNPQFARSVEDKFKILDLFVTRNFKFNAHNSVGETIWDLIYEVETIKCKNRVSKYISPDKPLHKYNEADIRSGRVIAKLYPSPLPTNWIQAIDPNTGNTYYVNTTTNISQWERPS